MLGEMQLVTSSSTMSIQTLKYDYLVSLNSHSLEAGFSLQKFSIGIRCDSYCIAKNSTLEDIALS